MRILISDGHRRTNVESGYGQISRNLGDAISKIDSDKYSVTYDFNDSHDVCLFVCPPYSVVDVDAPKAIFTMHETKSLDGGKSDWVDVLNGLDLVITPTAWNRDVWIDNGVTVPIKVVPLGIDPKDFYPNKTREFSILSVHENFGHVSSRENWEDTMRAYLSAFSRKDDVVWVVKTWGKGGSRWSDVLNQVRKDLGMHHDLVPRVRVTDHKLSIEAMRNLYQTSWVFVKNANREGWSLPLNEAVACGNICLFSDIHPLREIYGDFPSCISFELGNTKKLSMLFKKYYSDYLRWGYFKYTWVKSAKMVVKALEEFV